MLASIAMAGSALHMRWRRALGDVSERVAEHGQFADLPVDFVWLLMKPGAWHVRHTVLAEHLDDLFKREPCRLAHNHQLEL